MLSQNPPALSRRLVRTPAYPAMINEAGIVNAGHVLKLIDLDGSQAALEWIQEGRRLDLADAEYPGPVVVTASLDRTSFKSPIRSWEFIGLESRVTQVWKHSMEIQVRVWAESYLTGRLRDVATSHLVFVALDPKTRSPETLRAFTPNTPEEKQLASFADLRKKNRQTEGQSAPYIPIDPATDNPLLVERLMTPVDANAQGNVFGGIILDIIDEAGLQAAKMQTINQPTIGVRLDRMSFIAPTFIGEVVEARAIVTKTWLTSLEVQVEVEAVHPATQTRRRVASCYLVYVRTNDDGTPAQVPPFEPVTPLQIQRSDAAETRRNIRKEEEAKLSNS